MSLSPRGGRNSSAVRQALSSSGDNTSSSRHYFSTPSGEDEPSTLTMTEESRQPSSSSFRNSAVRHQASASLTISTSSSSSSILRPPPPSAAAAGGSSGGGKLRHRHSPSTTSNHSKPPPWSSNSKSKSSSFSASKNRSNSHEKDNAPLLLTTPPLPPRPIPGDGIPGGARSASGGAPTAAAAELATIGQGGSRTGRSNSSSSRRSNNRDNNAMLGIGQRSERIISTRASSSRHNSSTPTSSSHADTTTSHTTTPSTTTTAWNSLSMMSDPGPARGGLRYQLSSSRGDASRISFANNNNPASSSPSSSNNNNMVEQMLTIEIDDDGQDSVITRAEEEEDESTQVMLEELEPNNTSNDDMDMDMAGIYNASSMLGPKTPSSVLHALCLDAATPAQLWDGRFLVSTQAASQRDPMGRLPLHCLSQNITMAECIAYAADSHGNEASQHPNPYPCKTAPSLSIDSSSSCAASTAEGSLVQFVLKILQVYPSSMISQDVNEEIPFEGILSDWVEQAHHEREEHDLQVGRSRTTSWDKPSTFWKQSMATIRNSKHGGSATKKQQAPPTIGMTEGASSSTTTDAACPQQSPAPLTPTGQLNENSLTRSKSPKSTPSEWNRRFPIRTKLTAQAFYALKMLSAIVDYLDHCLKTAVPVDLRSQSIVKRPSNKNVTSAKDQLHTMTMADVQSEIIQSIASIPHLLKVILLMNDDEQRRFVFSTTITKRVMASKYSIGPWLTGMLQSDDRYVSNRAIEYLKMVSDITIVEQPSTSSSWSSRRRSFSKFEKKDSSSPTCLNQLCHKASQLQSFVPSLLSLSEKQVEEVSTTRLVKGVLDRIISTPFCSTVVFCDAIFLTILIAGFRVTINKLILGYPPDVVLRSIYVANTGIFYFIIRELGKAVSLCMITSRARTYIFSFWNLIDLLSTILVLISVVAIRNRLASNDVESLDAWRNTFAVTTGFLWLRFLSFLKGINMQLATFVLAILQITRDVVWFCVILMTLVLAFGQMFFTLLAPSTCAEVEADSSRECNQSEYYLKVYSLLISQEFDRDEFTSTFSVLLVVIYSFMVVLVMLNILIAVAGDTYEKCLIRSKNLFGRARVMMIAELVSFQNLLRRSDNKPVSTARIYKSWWSSDSWFHGWSRGSMVFLALSSVVIFVWVLGELVGYLTGPGHGNVVMSFASIFINVALFVGIMVFLSNSGATDELHDDRRSGHDKGVSLNEVGWRGLPQRIMLHLLGASGGASSSSGTFHDSWQGRLLFLRDEIKRFSDETKADTDEKIKSLETVLSEKISASNKEEDAMLHDIVNMLRVMQAKIEISGK